MVKPARSGVADGCRSVPESCSDAADRFAPDGCFPGCCGELLDAGRIPSGMSMADLQDGSRILTWFFAGEVMQLRTRIRGAKAKVKEN
jgi:hypothetical protein